MKLQELIAKLRKLELKHPDSDVRFEYYTCSGGSMWKSVRVAFGDVRKGESQFVDVWLVESLRQQDFKDVKDAL